MASPIRICIEHFIGPFIVFSVMGFLNYTYNLRTFGINALIFAISACMILTLLFLAFTDEVYEISWRAAMLGALCSLGFYIFLVCPPQFKVFGLYMSVMAFFHFSEFLTIAIIQPTQVSTDSFVINHSPQYTMAALLSWIEFFAEAYFCPWLKQYYLISYIGVSICIAGEFLRKFAMFTAGNNFHHLVQSEKKKDHVLVVKGPYSVFRHPSYVGWFYWAIGTQLILINPICIPAYTVVSWMFFNSRIYIEEITLLNFFGQNYVEYQKQVETGIPFIKGYKI
ncbi:protein-S-isoprenylcysteine O-methyltransferase [Anthonomus grandis grandis]|uniref:protein-S-isoprenylcysteine O-methyltransferase n=1 Tax=Anthonomus grandis grandis TaxID=2921223 RepID=UPI0021657811|nr:protein-S-isoprenylcysteine O-methyltransferase [Anthonomus grandis grandis]